MCRGKLLAYVKVCVGGVCVSKTLNRHHQRCILKNNIFHLLQLCKIETTIIELTWKQNPEIMNSIKILFTQLMTTGFPGGSDGKESTYNAGVVDSIPGSGRSPRTEHGNPLQYPCLENPMNRGDWRAAVNGGHKKLDTTEWLTHTQWQQDPAHHSQVNK